MLSHFAPPYDLLDEISYVNNGGCTQLMDAEMAQDEVDDTLYDHFALTIRNYTGRVAKADKLRV